MYDLEWAELADQLCQEYPALPTEVIVRQVGEAAEAVLFFDITEDAIALARAMVRSNLDVVRGPDAGRAADIVPQRGSETGVQDDENDDLLRA